MTDPSTAVSLATLLSFLGGAFGTSSNNNNNANAFQRTVGTAATVGLSLAILRFVVFAMKATEDNNNQNDDNDNNNNNRDMMSELLNKSEVLYRFVKTMLQRVLLQDNRGRIANGNDNYDDANSEEDDKVPIIHSGSCHCRSVCFELIAPRKVFCQEGMPGKIQYRHARVRARTFRFVKGMHFIKMYYVDRPATKTNPQTGNKNNHNNNNDDEVGAHSFCSRCGVHILHAPNSHSTALDVNVECLNQGDSKLQIVPGKKVNLSAGYSVMGQWDDQEGSSRPNTFATIAEEQQSPMVTKSPFVGYKQHHPLMRHQNRQDYFDTFEEYDDDDDSLDVTFRGGGEKGIPDTPSTVHTSQTESFLSSSQMGVPPTLTLDTRDCNNETDSVVSLSSSRSCFPALSSAPSTSRTHLLLTTDSVDGRQSSMKSAVSPSTTPLVRLQMQYYMRRHMSSCSSVSSSSLKSPASNTTSRETTKKPNNMSSFVDEKQPEQFTKQS